jgi:restriction system protein
MANYVTTTSDKSKKTAAILCACGFLGIGGLHLFYVGKIGKGLLYLFTVGFFLIGTIVDLLSIATGSFRDNTGAPLRISYNAAVSRHAPLTHPITSSLPLTTLTYEKAEKEAERKRKFAEEYETFKISVAGVTFKNDDGRSRQAILKRKMKEEEEGHIYATLEKYEYKGKTAIYVLIDDEVIGNVRASDAEHVFELMQHKVTSLTPYIETFEDEDGKTIYRCDIFMTYEKALPQVLTT